MGNIKLVKEEPSVDLNSTLEIVRCFLEEHSEVIPKQIVHGMIDGKIYKIQTNWFAGVVDVLEFVQEHIQFSGGMVPVEITTLLTYLTSQEFKRRERNKAEDIIRANIALELSRRILANINSCKL